VNTETVGVFKKNIWLTVLSLFAFGIFLVIFFNVLNEGYILVIDGWVSINITVLQTEELTKKVIFLTNLNGVIASTIIFVGMMAFFWYKKWYRDFWFFIFSFGGATLLFNIVKFSIERARPDARLIEAFGYSFPSGHSTTSMTLALAFYFIFVKRVYSESLRIALLLACIVWPLMIASSRVYLNVHWFSDVVAGLILGLFWVTLLEIVYPHNNTRVKEEI
jgi:undecaprenyl-diphosphatase